MALDYQTPQEIANEYLLYLKNLKPEVNVSQTDSDWWIRGQVVGGVLSGVYADQLKISNDPFPQSARRDALEKSLFTYFNEGFTPATQAVGDDNILVSAAATGATIPFNTQFQYNPNGNIYTSTAAFTFTDAVTGLVSVISINAGQDQNLLAGAQLSLPSPPPGVNPIATVVTTNISDGRDVESNEEAAARILRQIRTPLAGGKVSDYITFALDANPSVTSANILRYPFGFGTVGVIITAGTTDIDEALDNGYPIVLIPSAELVQQVQDYIETQNPITDCATVLAPASTPQNVTVRVLYVSGNNSTVLSGQTLTQQQLVQREVQRAIYKTPPGGRQLGASGYVVCAEIEEVLDNNLGASPYATGNIAQILSDRQVDNLSASGVNRVLLGNEVAFPALITVVEMSN